MGRGVIGGERRINRRAYACFHRRCEIARDIKRIRGDGTIGYCRRKSLQCASKTLGPRQLSPNLSRNKFLSGTCRRRNSVNASDEPLP